MFVECTVPFIAAVHDVVEHPLIAQSKIDGLKDMDIDVVLDLPPGIPRRLVDIRDERVVRVVRIHLAIGSGEYLFVLSGVPNDCPPKVGLCVLTISRRVMRACASSAAVPNNVAASTAAVVAGATLQTPMQLACPRLIPLSSSDYEQSMTSRQRGRGRASLAIEACCRARRPIPNAAIGTYGCASSQGTLSALVPPCQRHSVTYPVAPDQPFRNYCT